MYFQGIPTEGGQESLTAKQCAILKHALDVMKLYFNGGGWMPRFGFFKCKELKSLKIAMSLHLQRKHHLSRVNHSYFLEWN